MFSLLLGTLLLFSACNGGQSPAPTPETTGDTTVLNVKIATGSDDVEERVSADRGAGSVSRSSGDLELVQDRSTQAVGLRFGGVAVPQGAVIKHAYVQFTADETNAEATSLTLHGEAAENAAPFTSSKYNVSSRKKTKASVVWRPAPWKVGARGPDQKTPDIAPIVREIVSGPGWKSGNALALTVTGSGKRVAEAYEGNAAASLHVEYSLADKSVTPAPGRDVTLPARAAFYYPWFPETWTVDGAHVSYTPTLGYYASGDRAVVDEHIGALDYAKVDVAVASWWGPNTHKEDERIPLLLERTQALQSPLKWAFYYEKEGFGDPSLDELRRDLAYVKTEYASSPAYARVDGKPVLFVYNADDASCAVADRWARATGGEWYLVLKVFGGYRGCGGQPDAWHQYAPAAPVDQQEGYSYAVSPGFWRADEASPRLERDLERWRRNVRDMVASNEPWQLVTTFNEWGEGTAVEAASGWGAAYLDALASDGAASPPETAPRPDAGSVTFAAAGDFGGKDDRAGVMMQDLATRNADAFLLLGDMSYDEIVPESAWCDWVHGYLGDDYPLEVLAGNHEEDSRVDGFIRDFAACMPDRLNSSLGPGGYGVNFAFDLGPLTVVATSPDLSVDDVLYRYESGSPERRWLVDTLRAAKREGDWVVVGMHKNCLTIGNKSCEIGQPFAQLLVDEGVDLVLQGHDHDYQRSHALARVVPDTFSSAYVADSGTDGVYRKRAGTVFVIVGTVGRSLTTCSHSDPEYGYFAAHHCGEESSSTKGYLLLHVSDGQLAARFIATDGDYADAFVIR